MLDIGWSELLVIGVVALIVVGPKDLPILFRRLGEFTGKMRSMAREFTMAMDRAADEAGVREMRRSLHDIANPREMGLDAMRSAARDFTRFGEDLDLTGDGATPGSKPAPAPAATAASAPDPAGATAPEPAVANRPAAAEGGPLSGTAPGGAAPARTAPEPSTRDDPKA